MQKYLIMLILGSGLLVGQRSAAFAQGDNTFRGKALPQVLRPSASVSCFSDTSANTGYYRNPYPEPDKPEVVLKSSPLETQTAGGGYKISFKGDQATVVDEVMKQSYQFQVYQRRDDGVMLVRFNDASIVDQITGREVIATVDHEIVILEKLHDVLGRELGLIRNYLDVGIESFGT